MGVSRRALIKQAGALVAALGLTDWALGTNSLGLGSPASAKRYAQALAQSAGRKLALLIGIDEYAPGAFTAEQNGRLAGAVTDVSLQKELLIRRFGFLPADVMCLTNQQATRVGIYQALVNHLCNQAKPGDVVVFHFSGYGAQVRLEEAVGAQAATESQNGYQETVRSLVPYDGLLPTESSPALNDITETELKALLKQLKTKQVTTVLDAGFADVATPFSGGLRSRTRSAIVTGQAPVPFPLLANQKPGPVDSPFPGTLLRAANVDQVVIERPWNGFSAGAFTYELTQHLWTASTSVTVGRALGRSQETLLRWGGTHQQPVASVKGIPVQAQLDLTKTPPLYDTPLMTGTRGQGMIQEISADGKTATLWLGGLPARVLEYVGPPAVMMCAGQQLQLRSHSGLTAKARILSDPIDLNDRPNSTAPLQVGLPIWESVRVLPKSIDLIVALDNQLERIERVDATSALSALPFVTSTSDTELPADCLLSKPTPKKAEMLTASLNPENLAPSQPRAATEPATELQAPEKPSKFTPEEGELGYGLFSVTRSLIPGTLTLKEEAIKPAISRLTPKLQGLMALKMLRLSENQASSRIPVRVTLEQVSSSESTDKKLDKKLLISRQTLQAEQLSEAVKDDNIEGLSPEIPLGSQIRYQLFNQGSAPIYYSLITVDAREQLSAFCPGNRLSVMQLAMTKPAAPRPEEGNSERMNREIASASIAPNSAITIPSNDLDWSVQSPTGAVETYVIFSTSPLTQTLTLLSATSSGDSRLSPVLNPMAVIEALLSDLSQGNDADAYSLNVSEWATLNFTYRAV